MNCPRCDGTGWRPVEDENVEAGENTGRNGARRVQRCDCWREGLSSRLLEEARIPSRYRRCDLNTFVTYPNEKLLAAVADAKRFAAAFPAVKKGLCLIGPPGIGKTHLATGVLKQVILEKRVRGLFYEVPDLLRVIRSTYNPVTRTAESDVLGPVMRAELLVLDDLGKERPTEWVDEMMNLIVSTRYNDCLPTIFTTNFAMVEDDTDLDSLKVRVGFRLYSRLFEMCDFLEYDGGDFRLLPPNGGPNDLLTLWKHSPARRTLPTRAKSIARAELPASAVQRASEAKVLKELRDRRDPRDLKWPGGKGGRS